MNVIDEDSEMHAKEPKKIVDWTFSEVGALDQISINRSTIFQPSKPTPCHLANEAHRIQLASSNITGSLDFENTGTSHFAEHKQKNSINTEEEVKHSCRQTALPLLQSDKICGYN